MLRPGLSCCLWIALPEADRFAAPGFAHYEPPVTDVDGAQVVVFLGSLFGQTSPVPAIRLWPGRR